MKDRKKNKSNDMMKRCVITLITISFINYVGCSSYEQIHGAAIKEQLKKDNERELFVITKDYNQYHFYSYMYSVKNDSLLGSGMLIHLNREIPFNGKIALNDITDIKFEETTTVGSIGVLLGVLAIIGCSAILVALATDNN